jgi:ligand-binding SRPBCC domain-containing protein
VSTSNTFSYSSILAAPPEKVWARVSTLSGVNAELAPWFRMTGPEGLDRFEPQHIPLGKPLFRSWLLLFGVLPLDYDDLTFVRFEPGRGFLERSRMNSMKVWEHERTLEPHPEGTLLTDRVLFEPRLPMPGQRGMFSGLFRRRHEYLRRHFGGRPA